MTRLTPRRTDWLVCDMDSGVLRRERTRAAALAWVMMRAVADHVFSRYRYGPGAYEYGVGCKGDPESVSGWFIHRVDMAVKSGFAGIDRPLYPYVDQPHEQDPDVVIEIDEGKTRSWGPDSRR